MAALAQRNGGGYSYTQPIVAGVVLMVLQAFWGLAYKSLQDEASRLNTEIKDVRASFLSIREHDEYKASIRRDADSLSKVVADIQREQNIRGAHLAKIDNLDKRLDTQFVRVEEIARLFGSTFTPGTKLQELQRQIEILQERLARPLIKENNK